MYWLTGILGVVSMAAPFVLGYNQDTTALWTSLAVGGTLLVTSAFEGAANGKENWEYWVAGLVGLAAIAAPFVLNFSGIAMAAWALVIIGVLAVLASGTGLMSDRVGLEQ